MSISFLNFFLVLNFIFMNKNLLYLHALGIGVVDFALSHS